MIQIEEIKLKKLKEEDSNEIKFNKTFNYYGIFMFICGIITGIGLSLIFFSYN